MASARSATSPSNAATDFAEDGSDEVYTNTCGPCNHKGNQKKATQYCLDCQEPLCSSCKESHQTFKQSRHHQFAHIASGKKVLLDAEVKKSSKVGIRLPTDKAPPQITGAVFLQDGRVILSDRGNNNLKLLDNKFKMIDSLDFPGQVRDVTFVDNKCVMVILPNHSGLQYIHTDGKLQLGRTILLSKMPLGVSFINGEIFIACKTQGKKQTGEILILDKDGNLKRKLGTKPDGSFMFDCPSHFTVSQSTNRIYVSDRDTSTVTCISMADGNIVYQYKTAELVRARGVYVDAVDNLLVVGETSNNVHLLTPAGKRHSMLLTADNIPRQPCSIGYRGSDDLLIIGCYNLDSLLLFYIK